MNTKSPFELKAGDIPNIPGLTFRGYQGEKDYKHVHEIQATCRRADKIEEDHTFENVTRQYKNAKRTNPYTDMIFAELDGEPVGCGHCWWYQQINNDYIYPSLVDLKPEWRGKGIGLVMGQHLYARSREVAGQHQVDAPKFVQMIASDTQHWYTELIQRLGLAPARSNVWMSRPCTLPVEASPLPESLEVRPAKTGELRKVWDCKHEAFSEHFGAVAPTGDDYQKWVTDPRFQPHLWKIAWEGDQPIGNELNFILYQENQKYNRKRGYTESISVLPPWRQQGVARALLTQSIKMFQDMGMDETYLKVDTQNPNQALNFYKKIGYRETKHYVTYRKRFN